MTKIVIVLSLLLPFLFKCNSYNNSRHNVCFGLVTEEESIATEPQSCKEENITTNDDEQQLDYQILSNGRKLPLVGLSVGENTKDSKETTEATSISITTSDDVTNVISTALSKDNYLGYALFDIVNKKEERLISQTIHKISKENNLGSPNNSHDHDHDHSNNLITTIHIISKVSSELDYQQATKSIEESIADISAPFTMESYNDNPSKSIGLQIHFLLEVKKVKHDDDADDEAWRQSWKALEDMYKEHQPQPIVASIGVSNLDNNQLMELVKTSSVTPHFYRGNVLELEKVKELTTEYNIRQQVHQLFHLLSKPKSHFTYKAREVLRSISGEISIDQFHTSSSIAISYFINQNIGIITHTTNHIIDNSPMKAKLVIGPNNLKLVQDKIKNYMMIEFFEYLEPKCVKLVLFNDLKADKFNISWFNQEKNETIFQHSLLSDTMNCIDTYPNHKFIITDFESGKTIINIDIDKKLGETKYVHLTASLLQSTKKYPKKIHNKLPVALEMFWADDTTGGKGDMFVGKLASDSVFTIDTSVGHEFFVRNKNLKEIKRFKISVDDDIYVTKEDLGEEEKDIIMDDDDDDDDDEDIELSLNNHLDAEVHIYWVNDENKQGILQGNVQAKETAKLTTTIGNEFFIAKWNDEKIIQFVASEEKNVIDIINENDSITINNPNKITLDLYWIDPNTKEEDMLGRIEAEGSITLNSHLGDQFVIRDGEGNEHKRFFVDHNIVNAKVVNLPPVT